MTPTQAQYQESTCCTGVDIDISELPSASEEEIWAEWIDADIIKLLMRMMNRMKFSNTVSNLDNDKMRNAFPYWQHKFTSSFFPLTRSDLWHDASLRT